jgi:hypothetical protein
MMLPPRQTQSNGTVTPTKAKAPSLSRASTSTGQTPVSKFVACFQAILRATDKPAPYKLEDPERFYFDLFCLGVDKPLLLALASQVEDSQLIESGTVKVGLISFRRATIELK